MDDAGSCSYDFHTYGDLRLWSSSTEGDTGFPGSSASDRADCNARPNGTGARKGAPKNAVSKIKQLLTAAVSSPQNAVDTAKQTTKKHNNNDNNTSQTKPNKTTN
jgi:uncharacterized protein YoaH (UPF0181 family)